MSSNLQTICLTVDRREQVFLINTIIYAQVTDKLCTIYFTEGRPIQVFMTISALMGMLPKEDFKQISRSCIVSLKHIMNITDRHVIVSNGTELPYTAKKKTSILLAFQQNLEMRARTPETISWKLDFSSEFRCFDRCPIPFFILEKAVESSWEDPDFIVRYANGAMAAFRRTSMEALINSVLQSMPEYDGAHHRKALIEISLNGGMKEWHETNAHTNKQVHVICYQPHYGFCGCFVIPC